MEERTVTFLFTDIEGSTRLVREAGDQYPALLAAHRDLLREAVLRRSGETVQAVGEECLAVFSDPVDAAACAADAQRALTGHPWPAGNEVRVRMGIHTGTSVLVRGDYLGLDIHRAARICSAGHGGQVLVSEAARALAGDRLPSGSELRNLGRHALRDMPEPETLYQLVIAGAHNDFPPLRADAPEAETRSRLFARAGELASSLQSAIDGLRRPAGFERFSRRLGELAETAAPARRSELVELKADVLAAARSFGLAEEFVAAADRKTLMRRVEADAANARVDLAAFDRLVDRLALAHRELDRIATDLARGGRAEPHRSRLAQLAGELESAHAAAPRAAARKLARTWRRGVYRQGERYVVPYVDELGVERRPAFNSLHAARDFARGVRARGARPVEYSGPSFQGSELGAGGGPT